MQATKPNKNKSAQALNCLLLAPAGALLLAGSTRAPLVPAVAMAIAGAGAMAAASRRHCAQSLQWADYGQAIDDVLGDAYGAWGWLTNWDAPGAAAFENVVLEQIPDSISDRLKAFAESYDCSWVYKPDVVMASKAIIGGKGSGKSTAVELLTAEMLKQFPDTQLTIGDIHWDEDESNLFPGMPRETLLDRYLTKDPQAIYQAYEEAYAILEAREKAGKRFPRPHVHVLCEEFIGTCQKWTKQQHSRVLDIIEAIQDRGRKFNVNSTEVLHSCKKERTGIDSSILEQKDTYYMGLTLNDTTNVIPSDFNRKALSDTLQATRATLDIPARAFAGRVHALEAGAPNVYVFPRVDMNAYNFGVQTPTDWLEPRKEEIADLYQAGKGKSFTKLTEHYKLEIRKENGEYIDPRTKALKAYLEELKGD
jgi:hypothetical protein